MKINNSCTPSGNRIHNRRMYSKTLYNCPSTALIIENRNIYKYSIFYYVFRVNMEEANSAQIIASRNISINNTKTGKFSTSF